MTSTRNYFLMLKFSVIITMTLGREIDTTINPSQHLDLDLNIRTKDGYIFSYQNEDSERYERGTIDPIEGLIVTGNYQFTGTDGEIYRVTYRSDKNGYRPNIEVFTASAVPVIDHRFAGESGDEPPVWSINSQALDTLTGVGIGKK